MQTSPYLPMPHSLASDTPGRCFLAHTKRNIFQVWEPQIPPSTFPVVVSPDFGLCASAQLSCLGNLLFLVSQEVSTPSHHSYLSWIRLKISSAAPWRKLVVSGGSPKGGLDMTHSQTASPRAKIRLYHTKLPSKHPALPQIRLSMQIKHFSLKKNPPQLLEVQKQSFRTRFCFHITLLMMI